MPTLQDLSATPLGSLVAVDGVLAKGHTLFGAGLWQPIVGGLPVTLLLDADAGYVHPSLSYARSGQMLTLKQDGTYAVCSDNQIPRSWDPVQGWVYDFDPTYTQTIQNTHDSSVWSSAGCLPSQVTGMGLTGELDVNRLVEADGGTTHYVSRPASGSIGVPLCAQAVVRDLSGDRFFTLLFPTAVGFASNVIATFDLRSGTYQTSGLVEAAGMTKLANGFWLCWMRATPTAAGSNSVQFRISQDAAASTQAYAGTAGKGVEIWCGNLTTTLYPPPLVKNGAGTYTVGNATCGMAVPTLPAFSFGGTYELKALIDAGLIMSVSDGTFGNSSYLNGYSVGGGGRSSMNVVVGGTGVASSAGTGPVQVANTLQKFAFRVATDDLQPVWNDVAGVKDTLGGVPPVNQLYIGSNWAGTGNRAAAGIKRLWIASALTDAQLTAF